MPKIFAQSIDFLSRANPNKHPFTLFTFQILDDSHKKSAVLPHLRQPIFGNLSHAISGGFCIYCLLYLCIYLLEERSGGGRQSTVHFHGPLTLPPSNTR